MQSLKPTAGRLSAAAAGSEFYVQLQCLTTFDPGLNKAFLSLSACTGHYQELKHKGTA